MYAIRSYYEDEHLVPIDAQNIDKKTDLKKKDKENHTKKEFSLWKKIKSLYGLGDKKEEDLEFIYTSYANSNESYNFV